MWRPQSLCRSLLEPVSEAEDGREQLWAASCTSPEGLCGHSRFGGLWWSPQKIWSGGDTRSLKTPRGPALALGVLDTMR